MRIPRLIATALLFTACCHPAPTKSPATNPITVQTLTTHPVIGALGIPLGTAADIRATIIRGQDLGPKEYTSDYLLRVTDVNGRSLDNPPTLRFAGAPGFWSTRLGNDVFTLYKAKTGKDTGELNGDQIAKLERGYVGKQFHLLAFEEGQFTGVPANIQEGLIWQGPGFGFSTSLVILAERP